MRIERPYPSRSQIGSAVIEFALVIPVLMLILVGVIEFSVMLYDKAVITNASREGARYGIALQSPSYPTSAAITTYVKSYCTKLVTFSSTAAVPIVSVTSSTASPKFGDTLTVTVTYTFTDLVLHNFLNRSSQYTLTATTVMTYE